MNKFKKPKIVFSDFDGTLTDHTQFSSKFLDIIDLLEKKETPFVIVTGRSLSWAHFFLTHFNSLKHVISEGGGVISYKNERGLIENEFQVSGDDLKWLQKFSDELIKKFPNMSLTADSIGRVSDRAIELSDLENEKDLEKLTLLMKSQNINYSTSNVHLNFWAGEISKYKAVKNFILRFYEDISVEETMFFGDSLNDQTMFHNVEHSVGVSNIELVFEKLEHKPSVVLKGPENSGPNGVLNYLKEVF